MAQPDKIQSIQALRAIAAALVVLTHAQATLLAFKSRGAHDAWLNHSDALKAFGGFGVDIFFVVSGIVMTLVTWNIFTTPGAASIFLKKRAIRVFPIYWVHLATWVIIFAFFSKYLASKPVLNVDKAVASFFLIPYSGPVSDVSERYMIAPAWTLIYEMYFYCVTAVCLLFTRKWFLPIVCTVFIAGHFLASPLTSVHPVFNVLGNDLLAEFVYGILIGYVLRLRVRVPKRLALAALIGGVCLFIIATADVFSPPRGFGWGVSASMVVFGVVFLEQNGLLTVPRFLGSLGDSSYSLYLSHTLSLSVMGKMLQLAGALPVVPADVLIVALAGGCVAMGHVAFLVIERPMTAYLTNRFIYMKSASSGNIPLATGAPTSDS